MAACVCSVDISNSGVPGCSALPDVVVRLILMPMKDNSGTLNRFDLTALPSNTAILALINQDDDKKRLYPLPGMENVVNERGDNITQEFPSGTEKFIRTGVKTFSGEILNQGGVYAGQLEGYRCATIGAYMVDAQGNLIGDISVSGYIAPIPISGGSWSVKSVDTTDTTTPMVMLGFQWLKTLQDGDVGYVAAGDFDGDVDWLDYNGLLDLNGTQTNATKAATTATVKITTIFGSAASADVVDNLDTTPATGDLDLYNVTAAGAIVPSLITEIAPGEYKFDFTAVAPTTDILSVRINSTTNGYDDTNLRAVEIVLA